MGQNTPQSRHTLSREHTVLLAILLSALAIRLMYVSLTQVIPDTWDMGIYNWTAGKILDGRRLVSKNEGDYYTFTKPPGYPAFISLIYRLAGRDNFKAVFFVQAALSTLTLLLIYHIAKGGLGPRPALISVGLGAVFTDLVIYNITLMTETLALFLVVFALWFLLRLRQTWAFLIFSGLAFGLSVFSKPAALYFIPGILIWLLTDTQLKVRARLTQALLLGVFIVLPLAPWIAANLQAGNGLTGFGPGAFNVWLASDPRIQEEGRTYERIPRNGKTDAEIERELLHTALQNVIGEPINYARGVLLHLSAYFGADRDFISYSFLIPTVRTNRLIHEQAEGKDQPNIRPELILEHRWSAIVAHLPWITVIFWGAIGIIYAIPGSRQDRLVWLATASYLASSVFFTMGDLRLRFMVAPIFIIYAGYGLYMFSKDIRQFRKSWTETHYLPKKFIALGLITLVIAINFVFSLRGYIIHLVAGNYF